MSPLITSDVITSGGPVLVFGGPYSNLEATAALFAEAKRRAIPPERMICTGDIVAYGADAAATLDLLRASGIHLVMGNCEESLGNSSEDCGCGYAEGSACDRLAVTWYDHASRMLDSDRRHFMAGLPRRIDLEIAGRRLAVIHGSVRQINRFVFASTPAAVKREELRASGVDGVIAGHCGIPFTEIIDERLWHNAGAIGMPANDGTPKVWFSLLKPHPDGLSIEHHALDYDHATAAAKMRAAGLPEGYAASLGSGLWPSCDVLPARELKERGVGLTPGSVFWPSRGGRSGVLWPKQRPVDQPMTRPLDRVKFRDPEVTAKGERRASVALQSLSTLWFNTGTLCNITCEHCYIESSPRNDRLAYLSAAEIGTYLDEITERGLPTEEIGFTGGEPFMNPEIMVMLEECLARGFRVLVLTNAMRPMRRFERELLALKERRGERLTLRVSLDHYTAELHEAERGKDTWAPAIAGLSWLARHGFHLAVAGRLQWGEPENAMRQGFARLFAELGLSLDAADRRRLVLFPEMDASADVPEITQSCFDILHVAPSSLMCASQRMVVKRKGAARPSVAACTLLPYDEAFDLGPTLAASAGPIKLNHPHCAKFCVLGGASCSV
ncbi:MAG TPA: radical SAM protein [Stellaceae bacterium]|nr:radical SAM protein [Stellaceae bacterium]